MSKPVSHNRLWVATGLVNDMMERRPAVREPNDDIEYVDLYISLALIQQEANALGRSILIDRASVLYRVEPGFDPATAQARFDHAIRTRTDG